MEREKIWDSFSQFFCDFQHKVTWKQTTFRKLFPKELRDGHRAQLFDSNERHFEILHIYKVKCHSNIAPPYSDANQREPETGAKKFILIYWMFLNVNVDDQGRFL